MKRKRPQHIDEEATKAAGFQNKDSYIRRGKTFLFGADMTALRQRVYDRSGGYCEMPLRGVLGVRCNRNISWETMELDHSPSLAQGGDDTEEGTRAICRRCHVARHNRVTKFRSKANASM